MNSRAVSIATFACAVFGCWLPSLWLEPPVQKVRSILLPSAERETPWRSLQKKVRAAGPAMKQFQAVVSGVRGKGAGMAFNLEALGDLGCEEAEELAQRLAGEELGSHVTDSKAFLQSLAGCGNYARDAALEAWAAADPDAALPVLMTQEPADPFGNDGGLIQRLAARDPDKALAILKADPHSADRGTAWNAVLAACAEKDADYALAALQSAPQGFQSEGLSSLLSVMAAKDPRAALAWHEALPPELRNLTDVSEIMETWGQTDPPAALAHWHQERIVGDVDDPVGRDLAAQWAAKDPEALIQWATAQGENGSRYMGIAVQAIASRDPQRAAAMAVQLPTNGPDSFEPFQQGGRQSVLWTVGQEWAQKDSAAALTWARSLPAEDRSFVISGMRPQLSSLPPDERRAIARELGTDTSAGFQFLWEVDRGEAIKVFATQTPEEKLSHFGDLSRSLMAESPATAANLLQGVIQDVPNAPSDANRSTAGGGLTRNIAELTSTWTARDPAAAAAWVRQLPPGESQAIAASNVALTWGQYDLPAAREWVASLPAGPAREKAGEHLANLTAISGGE